MQAAPSALVVFLWLSGAQAQQAVRPDLLVADFEAADYGSWRASGTAFGAGPARGTLANQMPVTGFRGQGLVNSFAGGDRSKGRLTSPPWLVQRRFLTFLIGGGGYAGTTCMNLLHDGKVVRTATGPNTEPGGSEALAPFAWDLQDLAGKQVTIEIVDDRSAGWGHINVDHIVQTDRKPAIPERPRPCTREFDLAARYLLIPIRNGARKCRIDLTIAGQELRQFDAELAESRDAVSFWSFLDVGAFRGQAAVLTLSAASAAGAALIEQSDTLPASTELYDEALRPQLRFSQRLGWNNDPNGMVYADGEWHLYFQHNPYGWKWGNMHWGHAVSKDLVHWQQLPIAIYNKRRGDWAFSGGAVVDHANTAGWRTGDHPVIVASWTSTGRGECLAYSNDRGRTFTEFAGNPVVQHQGRDPKIIWYAPGKHWVMAVYSQRDKQNGIAFHSSPDLKQWKFESFLAGYYECPEIFELAVDGQATDRRWVVFAADARYALGRFDGKVFRPLHPGKHRVHHGSYYASQTFSNAPDGRRIQIGWARIAMPGMPFNQAFTLPHELTLRTTADGVRMFAEPVPELASLVRRRHALPAPRELDEDGIGLPVQGELFDVRARFALTGAAATVGLDIGGNRVVYDVRAGKLQDAALAAVDGAVEIRVLVDRPMLEIIGNRGRVCITGPRGQRGAVGAIRAFATGGKATLVSLQADELRSIWSPR